MEQLTTGELFMDSRLTSHEFWKDIQERMVNHGSYHGTITNEKDLQYAFEQMRDWGGIKHGFVYAHHTSIKKIISFESFLIAAPLTTFFNSPTETMFLIFEKR